MKKVVLATCLVLFPTLSFAEKPIGQTVQYKLDKGRVRTSTVISNARFTIKLEGYEPNDGEFGSFLASYQYDIDVLFSGRKQGQGQTRIPGELYSKTFLERLRNEKVIVMDKFKVKHLGIEDAQTPVQTFPRTDKVLIYDVKTGFQAEDNPLVQLFSDIAEAQSLLPADIQDLKVQMNMGLVANELEIVKLDLSGVISGTRIRMGLDYSGFSPAVL